MRTFSIDQATNESPVQMLEMTRIRKKIWSHMDISFLHSFVEVEDKSRDLDAQERRVLLITTSTVNCMESLRLLKWRRNFNLAVYATKLQNYNVQNALVVGHI